MNVYLYVAISQVAGNHSQIVSLLFKYIPE